MKQQRGFTLIELVMVIVILGILAAVAIPQFVDFKSDAEDAALKGVAGAASSAVTINYAGCAVAAAASAPGSKCYKINTCDSVKQALSGQAWPTGYSAAVSAGTESSTNGATWTCTVSKTGYTPATAVTFQAVAAGN